MMFLGKTIGKSQLPFIMAEISCNHEGDLSKAKELIDAAKQSGADAVKIQTYIPEDMTLLSDKEDFIIKKSTWKNKKLYNLYTKTQTKDEHVVELFDYAKKLDIPLFSSVFSERGKRFLEKLGCPAYKIASFEITDLELIRKVARLNKPMVISTGLASIEEIGQAVQCINPNNSVLLHCISAYPTKIIQANLSKIPYLWRNFDIPVGFSDHTEGTVAGPLACALGACMVEKHIMLNGSNSEDSDFSLYPSGFKIYVDKCKQAAQATFKVEVPEEEYSRQFRRSLYIVRNIKKGELFTPENIRAIRPNYGLHASKYREIVYGNKRSAQDLETGTALKEEHIK